MIRIVFLALYDSLVQKERITFAGRLFSVSCTFALWFIATCMRAAGSAVDPFSSLADGPLAALLFFVPRAVYRLNPCKFCKI
jgi:hypothetical protein